MGRPGKETLLLVLLGAAIFFPSLLTRDLWTIENRYAEVAREMRLLEEFLLPHFNGEVYAEKPPLFFWLQIPLQGTPLREDAGRLISALATIGTMLCVRALGRLWFSPRAGLLAAVVFVTSALVLREGRRGAVDPLLLFWVVLAIWGWFSERRLLFWLALALGVLTKGPVAFVAPAVAGIAGRSLLGPKPGRHWLWGPWLMLLGIGAWVVPACLAAGPEFTEYILLRQQTGRMVDSFDHARPPWHFVPHVLVGFAPWIFLLPTAAAAAWRARREPAVALAWFGGVFVVFSLISGKRDWYVLPLFPALALLVGWHLDAGSRPRWVDRAPFTFLAAAGLGLAALPFVLDHWELEALEEMPFAAACVAGGAAVAALALAGRRGARLPWLVGSLLALSLTADLALAPAADRVKSPRRAWEALRALAPAGEVEVAIFVHAHEGVFHVGSGRIRMPHLHDAATAEAFLAGGGRRLLIVEARRAGGLEGRRVEIGRAGAREPVVFLLNYEPPD